MNHAQAWLIAGRDAMWTALAMSPIVLLTSGKRDAIPGGTVLYLLVMALCYCAGAGYI